MIELPEANVLARQTNEHLQGRRVAHVLAGFSPHKWAWFHGDPADYAALLVGRTVEKADSYGGFVDIALDGARLLFAEGVNLRLLEPEEARPAKHQLLVDLDDGASLVGSVQMYGGLWAFAEGTFENPYRAAARAAPSPLTDDFDAAHLRGLFEASGAEKPSVKALLATEQRVPGLGNGVLQDILLAAGLHPRCKAASLTDAEWSALHQAVTGTLSEMTRRGGRDTERDLLGQPGGYVTKLSRKTLGLPCPRCGGTIQKAAYLGGSVYFCGACQRL